MNTFKEIFTGGACNADGAAGQRNQNPLRNFMDQMVFGQAANQAKMEGFVPQQPGFMNFPQEMKERQMAFEAMGKEWDQISREFDQKATLNPDQMKFFEEQWHAEQLHNQKMMEIQKLEHEKAWESSQIAHQSEMWAQEHEFNQIYENVEKEANVDPEIEQQVIKGSATQMMDVMMKDPEERFQNSKFLQFLGKINSGEYKIVQNELIIDPEKVKSSEEATLNNIFENIEKNMKERETEEIKMNEGWEESKKEVENEQKFAFTPQEEEEFERMLDEQYKNVLQDLENNQGDMNKYNELFSESWQKASDLEEQLLYKDVSDVYLFSPNNPFMEVAKPLQVALDLIAQGRNSQAVLAMEAHLQKNDKDAQTWRILGRLHQDNDQDQKAVSCLLNAFKLDPDNLDTLLALGISCTNTLDEVKAMNFLSIWMKNNKNYHSLNFNTDIIPQNRLYDDFKIEEIKEMNANMLKMFQDARNLHPNDPELLTSLSVLHFIARDYENSVILFKEALKFDNTNYSLWNKLGATLAHLGRADEAIDSYHRALELKPNYVRVWVNLGIAHAYKGEYEEASRFYLNALSFNPDAIHVWNYLQTTFVCMQRFDLVPKIKDHNVGVFADDFEIIRVEDLPPPELEYVAANNKFVIKEDVNKWVNQFSEQI